MYLGKTNRTIIEAHIGNPFQLPPAPFPVALFKQGENPNASINRNRFNVRDCSYDFKVHQFEKSDRQLLDEEEIIVPNFALSPDLISQS